MVDIGESQRFTNVVDVLLDRDVCLNRDQADNSRPPKALSDPGRFLPYPKRGFPGLRTVSTVLVAREGRGRPVQPLRSVQDS
ncbi:hypothetical protein GCM10012275_29030 [Longimycelium tulufanense]|uniref:Uncharacterized protein n=1 Tax=Longimycelium tulufanense TaxID=907463 RepID=A0A8J3FV84_9PSEU|nr:hypothetical protein GCM10012275_29030 [Longimycelium tulufanense]